MTTPDRKTVCVVDDDPLVCDLVRLMLECRGIRCVVATDGRTGLETVRREHPNAIILDMMMPEMNGQEFLAHLRKDPQLAPIPVMVMTGVTEDDPRSEEAWRRLLGVEAFLEKPLAPGVLLERLEKMLAPGAGETDAEETRP